LQKAARKKFHGKEVSEAAD
jgi:hypothetical protein